jgi:hypothetical protein
MEQQDFDQAENVFKMGFHADPYAKLQLEEPVAHDFSSDDGRPLVALGMNDQHEPVSLFISQGIKKNSLTIFVMYNETTTSSATDDNEKGSARPCHAGGRTNPTTEGCLASTGGLIIADYGAVNYHYTVDEDNRFWSSLFGFSEHEAERMFHCKDKCPYPEYEKFYRYYGQLDYGALWMEAALKGHSTAQGNLKFQHGQEDFSKLNGRGRMVAVETAAVTMNVRTHTNRIMTEWAIDACRKQECHVEGRTCPAVAEAWDHAVSLYVGSLVQPNEELPGGYESGHLYYGMADELCQDFATCGPNGDDIEGTSAVNHAIIQQFQTGRVLLEKGTCSTAELTYGQIVHLMTVPLIQGALRSAYRLQFTHKGDQEEQGRAVAYMASILPDLYSCSHQDADTVYNEMSISSGKIPDFSKVKQAFERNYQCMIVTCEDVGGLYDLDKDQYFHGASPCGIRRTRQRGGKKAGHNSGLLGLAGQLFVVGSVAVAGVLLAVQRERWVPALSSRADVLLSRVVGSRPVRYHEVHSHTLQLQPQPQGRDLSESYRSYGVEDEINGSYRSGSEYEMADHSESSTDYQGMDQEDDLL